MAAGKPAPVYIAEPDVEELEAYTPGGFHPTNIGDTFSGGRYRVVHKLGYGGYSLIWLARDQLENRYVALKMLVASETDTTREGRTLRHLQHANPSHTGFPAIQHLLDEFQFDGPNGRHRCLVSKPNGNDIAVAKEVSSNFMFPAQAARSLCAQLIAGVAYVHEAGICHGDLHSRNLLLAPPDFDSMTIEDIYSQYGEPEQVPIRRVDGQPPAPQAPSHAVFCLGLAQPANEIENPRVTISDFGTSFFVKDEKHPELHTPLLYSPPEDLFMEPVTTAADIWTLGVTLYDVMGERPLFEVFGPNRDDLIGEMVSTLGPLPDRWWTKWKDREHYFTRDGRALVENYSRINSPIFRPLHQRMWDMGRGDAPETCEWDVANGEMEALESLLRRMLEYEPSQRITAAEALASEYMVKWALPAWKKQQEEEKRPR